MVDSVDSNGVVYDLEVATGALFGLAWSIVGA